MPLNLVTSTLTLLRGKVDNAVISLHGRRCVIRVMEYPDGSPALQAFSGGDPYTTISVNTGAKLYEGEVAIKTWSENEGVDEALSKTGVMEFTGRLIPCGYARAKVFRVVGVGPAQHPALAEVARAMSPAGVAPMSGSCILCGRDLTAKDKDHSVCNNCWVTKLEDTESG